MVTAPVYADYLASFPWEQVAAFYTRLAEVTDYWDFSYSSVSFEPRYFYDETHFRECVGDMALARMFGDESVYIPEDFGAYVTADNVAEHVAQMAQAEPLPLEEYTAQVPVLMYHHISEEGNDSTELSPEAFEAQIAALAEAGYTSVFPEDLAAYVREGKELPEKPIVITFDDGYLSNYEYAYPILKKYGMVATIFVIGSTVGTRSIIKTPITPSPPTSPTNRPRRWWTLGSSPSRATPTTCTNGDPTRTPTSPGRTFSPWKGSRRRTTGPPSPPTAKPSAGRSRKGLGRRTSTSSPSPVGTMIS